MKSNISYLSGLTQYCPFGLLTLVANLASILLGAIPTLQVIPIFSYISYLIYLANDSIPY